LSKKKNKIVYFTNVVNEICDVYNLSLLLIFIYKKKL